MRRFLPGLVVGILAGAAGMAALLGSGPGTISARRPDPGRRPAAAPVRPASPSEAERTEGPAEPGPAGEPTGDEALLDELSRLAANGADPGAEERAAAVADLLEGRPSVRVPRTLFDQLAAGSIAWVRKLAARLAAAVEPPPVDSLLDLAVSDPAEAVRREFAAALGRLALSEPGVAERIDGLAVDPRPAARIAAVRAAWTVPALAGIVLSALDDSELAVRTAAIEGLAHAGPEGAEAALAVLASGDHEPAHVAPLVRAVVAGERFEEALDSAPRPEVVTSILDQVAGSVVGEDVRDSVRRIASRLPDLLPLYRSEDAAGYARLFRIAVLVENYEFVHSVVRSPQKDEVVRRGALSALLAYEPSRAGGIDLAEALLFEDPVRPALRLEILTDMARWRYEDEPCGQRIWGVVERLARDEENAWVRSAAARYLLPADAAGSAGEGR